MVSHVQGLLQIKDFKQKLLTEKFHDDYYEEDNNRKPYMEKVCFWSVSRLEVNFNFWVAARGRTRVPAHQRFGVGAFEEQPLLPRILPVWPRQQRPLPALPQIAGHWFQAKFCHRLHSIWLVLLQRASRPERSNQLQVSNKLFKVQHFISK